MLIPCFNDGSLVAEAVASVVDAEPEEVELVVVDDGSTDPATIAVIEQLAAEGIRVVRHEFGTRVARLHAAFSKPGGRRPSLAESR